MKKTRLLKAVAIVLVLSNTMLQAQTLEYPSFTVSVFRQATDQRYSDHKLVLYIPHMEDKLLNSLLPVKSSQYNSDSFMISICGELVNAGINYRVSKTDLSALLTIDEFSYTITAPTNMSGVTGYSVKGKGQLHLLDNNKNVLEQKAITISELIELKNEEIIKNNFTNALTNKKAVETYTLLARAYIRTFTECEDKYVSYWKKRPAVLTSFYKPEKKHPELSFFQSLNTRLVEDLNKKATTDYKTLIAPYEAEILAFMNKEWPKGYDIKKIKLAGHYTLAYLYYLAYDSAKLKESLDFLYENSNKFLGNRIQFNERKPLLTELEAYGSSQSAPKIGSNAAAAGGK